MDKEKIAELFNDSFERCNRNPSFMDIFYDLFLSSSPEVKEKFKDTDFVKQKRILSRSMLYLMLASISPNARAQLDNIAETHSSRGYDIKPRLYDLWYDCMLKAVEKCDPKFNDQVKEAWDVTLNAGIEYMTSRYE